MIFIDCTSHCKVFAACQSKPFTHKKNLKQWYKKQNSVPTMTTKNCLFAACLVCLCQPDFKLGFCKCSPVTLTTDLSIELDHNNCSCSVHEDKNSELTNCQGSTIMWLVICIEMVRRLSKTFTKSFVSQ